jgi:hypothetical protein
MTGVVKLLAKIVDVQISAGCTIPELSACVSEIRANAILMQCSYTDSPEPKDNICVRFASTSRSSGMPIQKSDVCWESETYII